MVQIVCQQNSLISAKKKILKGVKVFCCCLSINFVENMDSNTWRISGRLLEIGARNFGKALIIKND